MKIYPILNINNTNIKRHSVVAFGEDDGDFYSSSYKPPMSKADYSIKSSLINDKYDKMRSSLLNDADDLEFNSRVVWEQLDRIEKLRTKELSNLEMEYKR